jgi:hypothetical protein
VVVVLNQGRYRRAEPASQIGYAWQQRALQLGPLYADAATDVAPQRLEISFR